MATPYTHTKLTDVKDSAPGFGAMGVEIRFAQDDLEAERTGLTHHRFTAGRRQSHGHKHEQAEEVYVVLAGSGWIKLDDEIVAIERLDAIRVAPAVTRGFEAGPDGLEVLACGAHHEGDGELVMDWWAAD